MKALSLTFTDTELKIVVLVILFFLLLIGCIAYWLYKSNLEDEDIDTEELIQAWKNSKKSSKL